jgi:hypothetical protein
MKLYAQIGYGPGEKISRGLSDGSIGGAVFSPKDQQKETMMRFISDMRVSNPTADILIDPQFYTCLLAESPAINTGKITDWDYFRAYRKGDLEIARTVDQILDEFLKEVIEFDVTQIIMPNIYISQSFDSREAVIAKNFIRQARNAFSQTGDKRPLFSSLIICREALQDRREFEEFINDITMLEEPPDGFYLVIAGRSSNARSDIFHTDVLANWMLLNLSLSVNGFKVINGYSDIVTPFLGAAGGTAGATGWYSNLRMFSMDKFFPAGGGRLPIIRYLSKALLNRITFSEKEALSSIQNTMVLNHLPYDAIYDPEPPRADEVLQSWEAIHSLNNDLVTEDIITSLDKCHRAVQNAKQAYSEIAASGIPLDSKSNDDHIEPLLGAIDQFKQRAEL